MQEKVFFDKALGNVLREKRLELGWGATETALLYGESVRGNPITRKAYLRMEEGYLPKSPKRRMILAAMLGLTPLALGLSDASMSSALEPSTPVLHQSKAKAVNLREYRTALLSYWKQGYRDGPVAAAKDISRRIQMLHNHVLYASSAEKGVMKQLLCEYHIRFGDLACEQGFGQSALEHYEKAITLAHEEGYLEREASALLHLGGYFFAQGDFQKALDQYNASLALNAAPFVRGYIQARSGLTQACLATSEDEKTRALRLIDTAGTMLQAPEDGINTVILTTENLLLFKARALVAFPVKGLRAPDAAQESINQVLKEMRTGAKRLVAYRKLDSNIVLSQAWLDLGYYPIATTFAQEALNIGEEIALNRYRPFLEKIYAGLKSSSYGKDMEVAKLGIQLTKLKHIQIFND